MIKYAFLSLSILWAQPSLWQDESHSFLHQLQAIRLQLEEKMDALPPVVGRIAIHQIKISQKSFSPGTSRMVRSQIEEVFQKVGRKAVISAPELKTVRIVSTDTSFQMSNAIPDAEALWEVGRKFRIDGFVQGSLVKTEGNDLVLNLKLIQQGTAEILWSETMIAGPNKPDRTMDLEYAMSVGFSLWDVEKYSSGSASGTEGIKMYRYFTEFSVGEAITSARMAFFSLVGGVGIYNPVIEDGFEDIYSDVISRLEASAGLDVLLVFWPKEGKGYYGGLNLGTRAIFPHNFVVAQAGFKSRMTDHFGIEIGGSYYPIYKTLLSSSLGSSKYKLEMKSTSYEARIFYYF